MRNCCDLCVEIPISFCWSKAVPWWENEYKKTNFKKGTLEKNGCFKVRPPGSDWKRNFFWNSGNIIILINLFNLKLFFDGQNDNTPRGVCKKKYQKGQNWDFFFKFVVWVHQEFFSHKFDLFGDWIDQLAGNMFPKKRYPSSSANARQHMGPSWLCTLERSDEMSSLGELAEWLFSKIYRDLWYLVVWFHLRNLWIIDRNSVYGDIYHPPNCNLGPWVQKAEFWRGCKTSKRSISVSVLIWF